LCMMSPTRYLHVKYVCCPVHSSPSDCNIYKYMSQAFKHIYSTSCVAQKSSCRVLQSTHVTTHPQDCTVVHKCLPVLLPSQIRNCTMYSARAVPQRGFSYTCFIYSETSIHRSRYRRSPACIVCLIWSRN
jgi:hypothetical protein